MPIILFLFSLLQQVRKRQPVMSMRHKFKMRLVRSHCCQVFVHQHQGEELGVDEEGFLHIIHSTEVQRKD